MSKHPSLPYVFACLIVGTALLLAAYTGNAWAGIGPCVLFVFVVFPRWRSKTYRLVDNAISAMRRNRPDGCDTDSDL